MEKIAVNHFKAFGSALTLPLTPSRKSLLLYGENGAGKTSLYEALKLIFFRDRLLRAEITIGGLPLLRKNEEEAFYRSYRHQRDEEDIELSLNSTDFRSVDRRGYQCSMVSTADVESLAASDAADNINLTTLLRRAFIDCDDVEVFVHTHAAEVIARVNQVLKSHFMESIAIGQENTGYDIYIEDAPARLRASQGLHRVFNEAKLNLVRLLLLLESVLLLQSTDAAKHKILVLDDVVTSLDASNRLYIVKYLLGHFAGFQKVVLTHNIGYNNLFVRQIREERRDEEWVKLNMYQTASGTHLYDYDGLKKTKSIREDFEAGILLPNGVGNEIRKRFEAVVLELCKIVQIEAMQESGDLIKRLVDERPIYVRRKDKRILTANDLVKTLSDILDSALADAEKVRQAKDEIEKYRSNADLQKIVPMVKELKTFQKLMMHQLSHGTTAGMPSFNQKEVEASLWLLEKLEKALEAMKWPIGMV